MGCNVDLSWRCVLYMHWCAYIQDLRLWLMCSHGTTYGCMVYIYAMLIDVLTWYDLWLQCWLMCSHGTTYGCMIYIYIRNVDFYWRCVLYMHWCAYIRDLWLWLTCSHVTTYGCMGCNVDLSWRCVLYMHWCAYIQDLRLWLMCSHGTTYGCMVYIYAMLIYLGGVCCICTGAPTYATSGYDWCAHMLRLMAVWYIYMWNDLWLKSWMVRLMALWCKYIWTYSVLP